MWGKGPYHFDGVIRVPLLMRWPGPVDSGTEHHGVVSLLDLAPTILEATGTELPPWPGPATPATHEAPRAPSPLAGRTLLAERLGDSSALVEEDEDYLGCRLRTLVTERYRLTAYSGRPYGELFDLQEDPDEFENLWDDPGKTSVKQELLVRLLEKTMETELPLPRQSSRS
jgi:arylsulfatase A-like enzyme